MGTAFQKLARTTVVLLGLAAALTGCGGGSGTSPAPTYSITGRVTSNTTGLSGVQVAISGGGAGSTTDGSGTYTVSGVPVGSYTITPYLTGYTFTPLSQTVTVTNGDVTVPDFTATAAAATYTISGNVSANGTGLAGVTITVTGDGTGSLTTGTTGNYAFVGVKNGTYTITPTLQGYGFTPQNRAVTVNGTDQPNLDFTGAQGGSIIITF